MRWYPGQTTDEIKLDESVRRLISAALICERNRR
jgi:hypothetical protein